MPDTPAYAKPIPSPSPETQFFWDKAKAHELWLPHCRPCDAAFWFPRDFCPRCGSRDVEWRRASGRGVVYTFAIHHRAFHSGWANDVPYVTALVDLEGGVRLFTNLVDIQPDPAHVKCDMPVEAVFEDITDEVTLIKFGPAR
jgi:uncharacterized OB-fold protein